MKEGRSGSAIRCGERNRSSTIAESANRCERRYYSAFAVMKMYRKGTEPVLITLCSECAGA